MERDFELIDPGFQKWTRDDYRIAAEQEWFDRFYEPEDSEDE